MSYIGKADALPLVGRGLLGRRNDLFGTDSEREEVSAQFVQFLKLRIGGEGAVEGDFAGGFPV